MLQHPAFYAAFRLGTKTYLRKEPIVRPLTHVAGCFGLLIVAAIASLVAGHQLDRAAAEQNAQLMATFAVPSPLYGAELRPAEMVDTDEAPIVDGQVSAR
jgi:hypothetical protein